MTTSVSFQALVAVTRTVEHMPINERLVAVRLTQSGALDEHAPKISHKRFAGVLEETKRDMVLTNANLEKLLAGKPYTTENLTAASVRLPWSCTALRSSSTSGACGPPGRPVSTSITKPEPTTARVPTTTTIER